MMGIPYNAKIPYTKLKECHECGEKFKKDETIKSGSVVKLKLYDDPWADQPSTVKVHSDNEENYRTCLDKLTDTGWADFRYFDCNLCGRLIIRQCPYNGWRSYVKILDEEEVCVRCYQELRLAEGEPADAFEAGWVPGDFYNSLDLSTNGWSLVPGYSHSLINGKETANRFCTAALDLIKEGHKVLVNYDSMGYGGSEGYVSLYAKGVHHGQNL